MCIDAYLTLGYLNPMEQSVFPNIYNSASSSHDLCRSITCCDHQDPKGPKCQGIGYLVLPYRNRDYDMGWCTFALRVTVLRPSGFEVWVWILGSVAHCFYEHTLSNLTRQPLARIRRAPLQFCPVVDRRPSIFAINSGCLAQTPAEHLSDIPTWTLKCTINCGPDIESYSSCKLAYGPPSL